MPIKDITVKILFVLALAIVWTVAVVMLLTAAGCGAVGVVDLDAGVSDVTPVTASKTEAGDGGASVDVSDVSQPAISVDGSPSITDASVPLPPPDPCLTMCPEWCRAGQPVNHFSLTCACGVCP